MRVFLWMLISLFLFFHRSFAIENPSQPGTAAPERSNPGGLTQSQMAQGLMEALDKGVHEAISQLGHDGGFLTNLQVRIPMPQQLATVEKTLRSFGQDKLADDVVASMNHAAEQAVPQATSVFVQALHEMSIGDAAAILTGPEDAATQYFRRTTQTNLHERFLPIVKAATDKTGVTAAYKRLVGSAGQNKYVGRLENLFLKDQTLDIDSYVTDRALDGLFKMIAQEEARIRKDPVSRTSALLRQVFGAVSRSVR